MTKLYTKQGDKGKSSLYGGKRVEKTHQVFDALGNIDELNALIGVACSMDQEGLITDQLIRVQSELFEIGSLIATPSDSPLAEKLTMISGDYVARLEAEIDTWSEETPELTKFILPGGHPLAAHVFFVRAVARRSERTIAGLSQDTLCYTIILSYLNRLSDWLFACARFVNYSKEFPETEWTKS